MTLDTLIGHRRLLELLARAAAHQTVPPALKNDEVLRDAREALRIWLRKSASPRGKPRAMRPTARYRSNAHR